ncbi:MAG TPA: molybdate ABC transporter substrate-binding protein [Micropepsaceae bacterium]|nr:molybdate ABC transporter substrate-binding protein [Micropepsaceae bacterium]
MMFPVRSTGASLFRAIVALLFAAITPGAASAQAPDQITVLAAASLSNVLPDIARSYEAAAHRKIVFSFAASMTLARQIEATAGPDVFISADIPSMNYVDMRGLIIRQSRRDLLENNLVLIAPADSRVNLPITPGFKLADALHGGRLAMGEPASVPAGRYAQTALMKLGVWNSVSRRLALGEDVRATLAYVARGEAPLGIVYSTDARIEPRVRVVATFPANTHEPIIYPAALVKDAKPSAAAFLNYLQGRQARQAFERAGFTVVRAAGDRP